MNQSGISDHERYWDLFEEAPVAYHELDANGIVRYVNRAERELLGYAEEEMVGRPVWEFVAESERGVSEEAVGRKLSGAQPIGLYRRQYFTRGRGRIVVEVHERLIHDGSGRVAGIRTVLLDVTEQASVQQAEAESLRWLKGVLHSLNDAVIAVDPFGVVKLMNRQAQSLSGWREEAARGREIDEVLVLRRGEVEGGESGLGELLWSSLVMPATLDASLAGNPGPDRQVRIMSSPILADGNTVIGVALTVRVLE